MQYVRMGNTGAQVSRLCLGCMSFGSMADWTIDEAASLAIMKKEAPELVQGLAFNPIPDRFELTPTKPEDVDKLYTSRTGAHKPAYIDHASDGKKISHRILQVAQVQPLAGEVPDQGVRPRVRQHAANLPVQRRWFP